MRVAHSSGKRLRAGSDFHPEMLASGRSLPRLEGYRSGSQSRRSSPMSVAQPFFPSETNEILNPHFTKALKGFSTDEVLDYVALVRRRIESLEESLETV